MLETALGEKQVNFSSLFCLPLFNSSVSFSTLKEGLELEFTPLNGNFLVGWDEMK